MSLVIMFYFTSSMLNMFRTFNTSIIRSLSVFYFITTLVVCSCFDVCCSFGMAGLVWYPCSIIITSDIKLVSYSSTSSIMFRCDRHHQGAYCVSWLKLQF